MKIKLILFTFFVVLISFFVSGCSGKTYKVELVVDNSVIKEEIVKKGHEYAKPENPNKEGFNFKHWTVDNKEVTFPYKIEKETRFVAVFEQKTEMVQVDFYNGTVKVGTKQFSKGHVINSQSDLADIKPTKGNSKFHSWLIEGEAVVYPYTISNNVTFNARFENVVTYVVGEKKYEIKVLDGEKTTVPTQITDEILTPEFLNWYKEDVLTELDRFNSAKEEELKFDFNSIVNESFEIRAVRKYEVRVNLLNDEILLENHKKEYESSIRVERIVSYDFNNETIKEVLNLFPYDLTKITKYGYNNFTWTVKNGTVNEPLQDEAIVDGNKDLLPLFHEAPFKGIIKDIFSISGKGTVVVVDFLSGTINKNDNIKIVNNKTGNELNSRVIGIEVNREQVDSASGYSTKAGLLLRDIQRKDVYIGDVVCLENEKPTAENTVRARVYLYSKEEKGLEKLNNNTALEINHHSLTIDLGKEITETGKTIVCQFKAPEGEKILYYDKVIYQLKSNGNVIGLVSFDVN